MHFIHLSLKPEALECAFDSLKHSIKIDPVDDDFYSLCRLFDLEIVWLQLDIGNFRIELTCFLFKH